jgi:hypothetical protein
MRLFQSILSLFCALFITICSVAQFHHHSDDGSMLIFTCKADVCSYEHKNTKHTDESCKHGCHDGHQQSEKNCSLKINIAKTENKPNNDFIYWCIVFDEIVGIAHKIGITIICYHFILKLQLSKISNKLLRAPPYFIL